MKRGDDRVQFAGKHEFRRLLAFGLACALTLPMWSTGFSLAAGTDPASAYVLEADSTPYVLGPDSTPCAVVGDRQVTDWQWVDEEEMLVREDGVWHLPLPGAGPELAVDREVLQALLPARLSAVLQDGLVEELELTWDLSAIPEEGAYEGSYPLTASLPGGYQLSDTAPALEVQLELGGAETYEGEKPPVTQVPTTDGRTHKFVNNWSYVVPTGGAAISHTTEYDYSTTLDLTLSNYPSKTTLVQAITAALPEKIYCWGSFWGTDTTPLTNAGFSIEKTEGQKAYGWVNLTWDVETAIATFPIESGAKLQLYAQPISNSGYLLRVNTNDPNYKDTGNDAADTAEANDILNLAVTLRDFDISDHTVTAANPENVTVNLFDYWVRVKTPTADPNARGDLLSKSDVHYYEKDSTGTALSDTPTGFSTQKDWNIGINQGHLLLFGDGLIHAGLWNKGAGESCDYGKSYAGMEGIVKNILTDEGYPEINLSMAREQLTDDGKRDYTLIKDYKLTGDHNDAYGNEYKSDKIQNLSDTVIGLWETATRQNLESATASESLQYLFDPDATEGTNNCKTSYKNVTGLFQLDSQGYYYYNMRQNFAEFSADGGNHFTLYGAPATVRTDGTNSVGNFFPFNKGSEVFNGVDEDGNLTSSVACSGNAMNHHLGMTVTVNFRQPANGKINSGSNEQPMTFEFSGDDDVWIFIDDVLVLDMGGIHSEIYGIIDFATGNVLVGRGFNAHGIPAYDSKNPDKTQDLVTKTNLLSLYTAAGEDKVTATKWNGNTFASNTSHTLKMFYLERGNYDSSLALRFNLQPLLYQQIRKVDQNGNPVEGVKFDLFEAEKANANDSGAIPCRYTDSNTEGKRTFYVKQSNATSLVTLTTQADGSTQFKMDDDSFFNFADRGDAYYILHESQTPDGYRAQPVDIVLHYDVKTSMLSVANRWTTGAYACSVAHVTGPSKAEHGKGLVMAVPLLKKNGKWYPLYGDNLNGFHTVQDTDDAGILLAALYQARAQNKDSLADWHLSWDAANSQLKDTLSDLPGLATRYTLIDPNGDLQVAYVQISRDALSALGVTGADSDARYEALHNYLRSRSEEDLKADCKKILTIAHGFDQLTASDFNREFRSLIFVPNERRELRVLKMGPDGKPLAGAEFTLYSDENCTTRAAFGTTDADGMLVFSPTGVNSTAGQANMAWADARNEARYYLKETAAPAGYTVNKTVIPVVVGIYSIYADAGKENDGVSVMAGVGRLTQTMHQFGKPNDVDITLQDITAFMQTQKSTKDGGTFQLDGWEDVKLGNTDVLRSMNLHYNMNNRMNNRDGELVDYGLHDEDGGKYFRPFFITDTGFVRARVQQMPAEEKSKYGSSAHSDANWDNLGSIHLTNLFSLLNVVVVTDTKTDPSTPSTASLTISKKVEGPGLTKADYTRNFSFKVELTNADGTPLDGSFQYNFYGKDKWGYLSKENNTLVLHHDESVTILGLPEGTKFKVTETDLPSGWSVTPGAEISGTVGEKEAAFTNTKGDPPSKPDGPDGPEESEKPTPTPTATPTGTPGPSPTPGVTPVPSATPTPEPTPTAAPPTETPTYPTELPDPNDPDSPEVITIEEEGVPKTYVKVWNPETEEWEYIDEEDVPLWSAVPETGEGSGLALWSILAALSLGGLFALTLPRRKRGGRRLRRDS